MEAKRQSHWPFLLLGLLYLTATLQVVQGGVESEGPSESECRPFIEKALKELETGSEASETTLPVDDGDSKEDIPTVEITTEDDSIQPDGDDDDASLESAETENSKEDTDDADDDQSTEQADEAKSGEEQKPESAEDENKSEEDGKDGSKEDDQSGEDKQSAEDQKSDEDAQSDEADAGATPETADDGSQENQDEEKPGDHDGDSAEAEGAADSKEDAKSGEDVEEPAEGDKQSAEDKSGEDKSGEDDKESEGGDGQSVEDAQSAEDKSGEDQEPVEDGQESKESTEDNKESAEDTKEDTSESVEEGDTKDDKDSAEDTKESAEDGKESVEDGKESAEDIKGSVEDGKESTEDAKDDDDKTSKEDDKDSKEDTKEDDKDSKEDTKEDDKDSKEDSNADNEVAQESVEEAKASVEEMQGDEAQPSDAADDDKKEGDSEEKEDAPEEELILEDEKPDELRPTDHLAKILKLNEENENAERIVNNIAEITLRELKKLYENAIKPLETLYKYRDLSNRHFGDAEIFAKPLVLFMGPWSGGKSSLINYIVDNEYNETSLRTGAEPSPAYFNILMHGDEPEVLDGTQLAADFTFSGLQKFGQGLEERLRGLKLPNKLLEKINIVEIPGILEVRKQISRVFPFNDACQWFIDRADIIFLVYDPSKLDVGPETEAILDQLKGREHQTRIILNKADQVKPEELMRVQGALIWNISPLMSSAQPPVMYTASLWSRPYEPWAPVRLLQAQERAFLRDLRTAIDKRIENKIASARRFAVRVRNHAKMVDCYLTTYYNHKSVFGNRKQVADAIIEHPQDYHIYEGLSTLTNISRYDLPDPDVYRDFFRLNPLYEFQQLSATCTYFRGCPINRLDVCIAYDLPELVGKHKRMVEEALAGSNKPKNPGS